MADIKAENRHVHLTSDGERVSRDEQYQAIVDSAVDFAIVATDQNGFVTAWNVGAERTLGWSAGEMIGKRLNRFFTPEDQAEGRPEVEMREATATGRANDERWHMKKDGSRFWASGEMLALRDKDNGQLGFVKILRDRTEQRLANEKQQADAEFMRSVLASSGDCIKVLDLDANLLFMNEADSA